MADKRLKEVKRSMMERGDSVESVDSVDVKWSSFVSGESRGGKYYPFEGRTRVFWGYFGFFGNYLGFLDFWKFLGIFREYSGDFLPLGESLGNNLHPFFFHFLFYFNFT